MSIKEYERATAQYQALANRARAGDKTAFRDKAQARLEMRHMERAAARDGVILQGGKQVGEAERKKTLQSDYVRKIQRNSGADGLGGKELDVAIDGKETKLSEWHKKRLGV